MDASITVGISEVLDAPNLFAVLGLPVDTSLPAIVKRAYYKRALQVHPDKNSSSESDAAFKKLADAFEIVGDPKAQEQYLIQLASQPRRSEHNKRPRSEWATAGASSSSPPAPNASRDEQARARRKASAKSWADMMREFEAMEYAFEAANDEHRNAQRAAADAKRERQEKLGAKRSKSNAQLAQALGEDAEIRANGWISFKGSNTRGPANPQTMASSTAPKSGINEQDMPPGHTSQSTSNPACCWLCRRKFPNELALQRHEQMSELHKENLKKRYANGSNTSDGATEKDGP